jgi:DNA-binding beta-propeller fold protein YncE
MTFRLMVLAPLVMLAACAPMAGPESVGAEAMAPTLFVAAKRGNTLSKVDLATGKEVLRLPSCTNPHELATSPDGQHVALACYGGTSVDIFRTDSLERVASIDLGANARPHGIVWHASGDLYATAEGRRSNFWLRNPLGETREVFEFGTDKDGTPTCATAATAVQNYGETLYRLLQLAVRSSLGQRSLDEVLADKVDIEPNAAATVRTNFGAQAQITCLEDHYLEAIAQATPPPTS